MRRAAMFNAGWGKQAEGGRMEMIALIVLVALFLASGRRNRLFGAFKEVNPLTLKDLFWRSHAQ